MKECDHSKIHISSNFILSISLLIMFDTLLLRPSPHCNTPLHFTTLHPTTLHYTSPNYTSPNYTSPNYTSTNYTSPNYTSPNYISLHFTQLHFTTLHPTITQKTSINLHYLEEHKSYTFVINYVASFNRSAVESQHQQRIILRPELYVGELPGIK